MTDPCHRFPRGPILFRTEAPLSGYKLKRQRAIAKVLKAPKETQLAALMRIIRDEVLDCDAHFKPFHSAHEAYGVMLEEFDELWDEVKKNQSRRDYDSMAKEAVQVSAMAIRLLRDVCCDANRGHEKYEMRIGLPEPVVDMIATMKGGIEFPKRAGQKVPADVKKHWKKQGYVFDKNEPKLTTKADKVPGIRAVRENGKWKVSLSKKLSTERVRNHKRRDKQRVRDAERAARS